MPIFALLNWGRHWANQTKRFNFLKKEHRITAMFLIRKPG